MTRIKGTIVALLVATSLTSGCALTRSSYEAPQIQVASQWGGESSGAQTIQAPQGHGFEAETDQWWTAFGDERLNRFMSSVLERNNGLAAAAIASRRAALQAGLTAAETGPQVNAGAGASGAEQSDTNYSASASISYEIDLWGAIDASRDAASWEASASDEDRKAVALSLTGTAATLYFQLAYLNLRVESAEESLSYTERTQQLVETQYRVGAVSGLERAQAQQSVTTQRASLIALQQTRTETRNAIALLRDGEAWPQSDEPHALPDNLPEVAAGVPAQLLSRRPDLRAAELRLRETLASGDASRLSYYPTLSLTASDGGASTSLKNVLSNPVGTLAAEIALPFLQVNEMVRTSRIASADYDKAVVEFRQTLREALVEVEDSLSARTHYAAQGEQLEASLSAAQTAERLYETRYRAGADTLRNFLDAQESRRTAELSVDENRFNALSNQVDLYLAVGGGVSGAP